MSEEGPMLQARNRGNEQLEIVDEQGVSLGQVVRPVDPWPLGGGAAKGTVYLQRAPAQTARRFLPPAA